MKFNKFFNVLVMQANNFKYEGQICKIRPLAYVSFIAIKILLSAKCFKVFVFVKEKRTRRLLNSVERTRLISH